MTVSDTIVCPYCGMSTWIEGHCALPGCEGHTAPDDDTVVSHLRPEVVVDLMAVVTYPDGRVGTHHLGTARGYSYWEFADNFDNLISALAHIWPDTVRAQGEFDDQDLRPPDHGPGHPDAAGDRPGQPQQPSTMQRTNWFPIDGEE